jgi:type IV secretion system protein VirB4
MLLVSSFMLIGAILTALCIFLSVGIFVPYKKFSKNYSFTDLLDYAILGPKNTVLLKNGAIMKCYRITPRCTSYLSEQELDKLHSMIMSSIRRLDKSYIFNCDVIRSKDASALHNSDEFFYGAKEARKLYEKRAEFFEKNTTYTNEFFLSFTKLNCSLDSVDIEALFCGDKVLPLSLTSAIESFNHEARSFIDGFSSFCEVEELSLKQKESSAELSHICSQLSCMDREDTFLSQKSDTRGMLSISEQSELFAGVDLKESSLALNSQLSSEASERAVSALPLRQTHETVNYLYSCINGVKTELSYPRKTPLLDLLLSSEDFIPGRCPKLGDRYIGVISIDGFPLASDFGMLKALCSLPFEYRFSNRFISYSKVESSVKLALLRRLWIQKRKSFLSMLSSSANTEVDKDAEEMVENVDEARKSMAQQEHNFGALSSTLIIFDDSIKALEDKARLCLKLFESLGFQGRVESLNATDAYLGSLPGHSIENLRRAMVSGEVVADLLPLHKNYCGERYSPNPNYGKSAPNLMSVVSKDRERSYLNLHVKDLANCLVVGPPGSGKSVFLGATLLSLLKYEGMKIFAFDKGQSFYALSRYLKGNHLSLDEASSHRFCPLYDLSDNSKISAGAKFVEKLYEYAGKELTDSERQLIFRTVELLSQQSSKRHSLTDFYNLLNNSELKLAISNYLVSVNPDSPLDGTSNPDLDAALTVFECGSFFESGNKNLYPVLDCIFSLINSEIQKVKCSAIIIDEAWLMLSNSYFCAQLLSWIKTVRKHNTVVILATQSVNDFARSKMLEDILDCVKTRIYLPNADIKSPTLMELYSKLGLNDLQREEIFRGVPKQDLFLHKEGNFMQFNLALSESELKLLSFVAKDRALLDMRFNSEGGDFIWDL